MDNENKHIIIPDRGFKLPKHYFESFNDRLMQKINAKGTFAYNVNQAGFLVPINYFENLEHNIFAALKDQQITQKNGNIHHSKVSSSFNILSRSFGLSLKKTLFYSETQKATVV